MTDYADLILENAEVITCDPLNPQAESVAARDGRIMMAGTRAEIADLRNPQTRVIDCQHKTIVPGFIDAHCHFFALVRKFLSLDLSPSRAKSIEAVKAILHHQAGITPPGRWITGTDYNDFYLAEKRHPTRHDLDTAVSSHPVMIVHRSMHACVLNSLAMQIVGITNETEESPGSMIDRDLETGEPNGILYEMLDFVQDRMKIETSREDLDRAITTVDRYYLSMGITSIGEATVTNDLAQWETYQKLKQSGQLNSRINMMPGMSFLIQFQKAGLLSGTGDNQLRVGPLKIILNETTGNLRPTQAELNEMVLEAGWAGFQVAIHAVEVSTVEAAVKALEYAQRTHVQIDPRFRLEHCSECPPELRQRLAKLKAVIVSQPSFLYYGGERYLALVRPEAQPWLYTFKSWMENGLTVAGSSDSPVVPANPIMGIYSAVTRRAESGQSVLPGECVTAEQSVKMFTINAAYATFEENIKGSLSPGKLADMVLLNGNPLTCAPEQIKDIQVELTVIDGKKVWEK
jgi:predicted amidohydrolase YtcJ